MPPARPATGRRRCRRRPRRGSRRRRRRGRSAPGERSWNAVRSAALVSWSVMPDDPLRLLAAEPEQAAVLLDVDGTLAPIAARPEDAHVPEETRVELARLAARYALGACVSGRPRSAVQRMVGVAKVAIVGEHGLELAPEAAAWAGRIAEFARGVDWAAERTPLSVSFHFRRAEDEAAARAYLTRVAAAAETEGLVPRWGRMVLEVRPPVDAHKGTAVRALVTRAAARRALYAGDDHTDVDAFGGLDGLELGVRVAVRSVETPADLLAAADLVVDGTDGVLLLLRQL